MSCSAILPRYEATTERTPPEASPAVSAPIRSASGTNGRTTSVTSAPAETFTAYGTNSPFRASRTISATVVPALSWASRVDAPRWGVTTTPGSPNRGESVVGSTANTSSAAPAEVPVFERLREGLLVDDAAARGVHEPRAGLHHPELFRAEQALGLRGPRQVDRHEIRLDQQRFERGHRLDAHLLGSLDAHVRIERDHAHPEAERTSGDQRPDPAEADQPDRLAGELDALPCGSLPPALGQGRMRLRDASRLREEQRHGVLGGADDVRGRCVHDHHASARRGVDVDVVEPDAGARHDPQVRGRVEHFGGHLRRAADDQRVVRRDLGDQVALGEIGPHVDLEVLAEQLEALRRELLGDEDPHVSRPPGTPARRRRRPSPASRGTPGARASSRARPGRG